MAHSVEARAAMTPAFNLPKNLGLRTVEAIAMAASLVLSPVGPAGEVTSLRRALRSDPEVASTYQPPFGIPVECRFGIDCIDPAKTPVQIVAENLDGKTFGFPDECGRPSVPCDPEQDPLDPSKTPSDQLPQGSQPA